VTGDTGATGVGATGPTGPAGAGGSVYTNTTLPYYVQSIAKSDSTATDPSGTSAFLPDAVCNAGDIAIGGGMSFTDDANANGNGYFNGYPPDVSQGYPSDGSGTPTAGGPGWAVRLSSAHGTTNIDVTVYVFCTTP
jgi:hypothetical protein